LHSGQPHRPQSFAANFVTSRSKEVHTWDLWNGETDEL
jgi:hypothetical protein